MDIGIYDKEDLLNFSEYLWTFLPSGDAQGNKLFQDPESGDLFSIGELISKYFKP